VEGKRAVAAEARAHDLDAEIETLKLTIAKLRHDRFGNSSERTSVLMDQLELQLGELVERRAEETAADAIAAAQTDAVRPAPPQRRMPARRALSNNAAERALRGIAVGRRNWTFCGSDPGGHRAAIAYTLIESAKLSGVDPKAWLADVLARIADHPAQRIDALLPWNWKTACGREAADQVA
jgi:transposase